MNFLMNFERTINLTTPEMAIVKAILAEVVPGYEVRVFGSHLKGGAKKYSDLDLVVVGNQKLERSRMAQLKSAFQNSKLPFRVEVLDWHRIPSHFKQIIEDCQEIIQKSD